MRVLIITGGTFLPTENTGSAYHFRGEFDRVIAADRGLAYCRDYGIVPTDILGDFDSLLDRELLEDFRSKGIPVRTFPRRKDYTDTELALFYAEELGADEIVLYGATGTRYDHSLANICLMVPLKKKGIHTVIVDAHNEMEIMIGPEKKEYQKNDFFPYFSILSLTKSCEGINMDGFSYPLKDYHLDACISLGISNEITQGCAQLSLEEGILLVVRAAD